MRPLPFSSLGALLLLANPAAPQDPGPLVTDRPDFSESAATVQTGAMQLEAGYTFARTGVVEEHAIGELLVRIGLASRLELRVGLNSFIVRRGPGVGDEGLDDTSLGAKFTILPPGNRPAGAVWRPAVAILVATSLPTGADGVGGQEPNPEAKLALAWELGPRVALSSNLNLASTEDGGQRFEQVSGSVALGVSLTQRLGAYVEYYGFSKQAAGGPDAHFVNAGATLLGSDDLQFDARAGLGLNDLDPDYFVGVGLAWRARL